ncbi:MAG: histidine kinase, partial [Marinobacter sp.]|nr:histidine kinase [Marinobacter sp.]
AAQLVRAWGLGPMAEDAMRYQHALPSEIRDAGHLVKLISLATRLALSDAAGIAAAATVFGLSEELTRELQRRIDREVSGVAGSLGITLSETYDAGTANRRLKQAVLKQALASQSLAWSAFEGSLDDTLAETVNSLTLVTGLPALCFSRMGDELVLLSTTVGSVPPLTLKVNPAASVLTAAFATGEVVALADRPPSVQDRQLLSLLHTPSLVAIPLLTGEDCPAMFVLGTDDGSADIAEELGMLFCRELAGALLERRPQTPPPDRDLEAELMRQSVRRQVHEISNPLTIIRQYIHQLRHRLTHADVQAELDVIHEELDRASDLLLQISQPDQRLPEGDRGTARVNDEIATMKGLLLEALFSEADRSLTITLCDEDTGVAAPASVIRQILINLTRNGAECLGTPGQVSIRTAAPVWQNGRRWVELEISDDGPGIPDAIRDRLFAPVNSTKGRGHSGLGLSIVKQLIDDMEGIIACGTGHEGTTFRIWLPAVGDNNNQND